MAVNSSIDGILSRSGVPNPVFFAEAHRSAGFIISHLGPDFASLTDSSRTALNEMLNASQATGQQQQNLRALANSIELPISRFSCMDVPMANMPTAPGHVAVAEVPPSKDPFALG